MSNSALFSLFGKLFNLVSDLKNQNEALLNKVQVLHTQNEFLTDKVLNLKTSVGELNKALKKGLSAAPTQLSLLKAVELAQSSEARKSAVVIKNTGMASDASNDSLIVKTLASECSITENTLII
uniref:Uncharacterized protein n=1 Tax=Caenorhabditis japonica TaxID=281687 RepID=A0A8R1EUN3_CAEJA